MEAIVGDTATAVDKQQAPAFTADDELRELQSLTVAEITDVMKDLHGPTTDVGGSATCSSAPKRRKSEKKERGPPPQRHSSIEYHMDLEQQLMELPPHAKASYIEACLKCPQLLTPEHKAAFLEHCDFDARSTATLLCEYWKVRVATFGPERAFLPMTLAGAMQDEVQGMIKHCPWYLLPDTDLSGRKVLFLNSARRNFEYLSEDQEVRCLFYILDTIAFDPSTRTSGLIMLSDASKLDRKSFSFRVLKFLRHLTESVFPMQYRGSHICFPSPVFYYVIYPVMRTVLGKKIRLRIKLHYGNEGEVVQSLEKYRFTKARLPKAVGGFRELDCGQWVAERSIIENLARAVETEKQRKAEEILSASTKEDTVETVKAAIISQFNQSLLAMAPENSAMEASNQLPATVDDSNTGILGMLPQADKGDNVTGTQEGMIV